MKIKCMMPILWLCLSGMACFHSAAEVYVLVNDLPGADPRVGRALLETLSANNQAAQAITPLQLVESMPEAGQENLLVLTDAGILPLEAAAGLNAYLDGGGRLVAAGGTLFRDPIGRLEGKWVTQAVYQEQWSEIPLDHLVEDFKSADLNAWTRSSNDPGHPSSAALENDPGKGSCLHIQIRDLNGWETLYSPPLAEPMPEGLRFTTFWAKGGPKTDRMLFEWEEADGSRWMATVTLTPQWKRYVLTEKDFHFWESIPARSKTSLNLQNVKKFNVGLAATHTGGLWGDHDIWITEVGTCKPGDLPTLDWHVSLKPREPLFPVYHSYACEDVGEIIPCKHQGILPSDAPASFKLPESVQAFHPRPQSTGYGKNRTHRWIPLLEAFSPKGDYRGTLAVVRFTPELKQMWAAYSIESPGFYLDKAVQQHLHLLIKRMLNPAFLWEAGSSRYTSFPDQAISIGTWAVAPSEKRKGIKVAASIREAESGKEVWKDEHQPSWDEPCIQLLDTVPFEKGKGYTVQVQLLDSSGQPIDSLSHPLHIWASDPNLSPVTIRKGDFYIDEKAWIPYGVNYMPSSGIAREEWEPFEQWLGPRGYDPEIIERDLVRVADLGMNMVSVFLYHDSHAFGNLIDFLRLCEKHHLRVNLSLRPGTPLDFEWEKVRQMIEENRLAQDHSLFAYDLAWEPHFEGVEDRSRYTKEWNEWIHKKHGSLENAFKAWNHKAELKDGQVPVPQSREWYEKGPWDAMALDYGDFLNDLLERHYSHARDLVRGIDPNHAVSFRMQHAGDPTYWGPTWIPYDFRGVARGVDILEPEAYGRIGDWEQVKGGIFTVDYGRAVAPELPVFWAEAGYTSWNMSTMDNPPKNLEVVASFYRHFHRMLIESHSNGIAFWWFPGGFRANENSDFGILNPDGTDRPVTKVIREMGPQVVNLGAHPSPTRWIEVDLRTRPGGLAGAYNSVKEEYWKAIEAGERVGLKLVGDSMAHGSR